MTAESRPGPPLVEATTIAGVKLLRLTPIEDHRGSLVELCRLSWLGDTTIVQWNVVTSGPNVLRGMHWHNLHWDVIAAVQGRLTVGLTDLRIGSPTELVSELIEVDAGAPASVLIPPGVAHGFFSPAGSTVLYGVSRYWDPADELGVRFDDPDLSLDWDLPPGGPVISERDALQPPLSAVGERPRWLGEPEVAGPA
jgi:dTDP-4-dehydrorhamnose 3,5-epimerase